MTQRVEPQRTQDLKSGDMSTFTARQNVTASGTAKYFIENPSGNNESVEVANISVNAGGQFDVDIHTNVTEDTAGTDLNKFENFVGDTSPTNLETGFGGTYSNRDTDPFEDFVPGSSGNRSLQVGAASQGVDLLVSPGNNVLIDFTNVSGAEATIAPRIEVKN